MEKAEQIIKAIVDNYSYRFAQWQPDRIKRAIFSIDSILADKLDYSNSDTLIDNLRKELNVDLVEFIIKHNYPVWIPCNDIPPDPINKNAVITYSSNNDDRIQKLKEYANRINADFVIINGRTQGSLQLERFRVKSFLATYDRIIFLNYNVVVTSDCPDLFSIVPEDKIGIYDCNECLSNLVTKNYLKKIRLLVMKSEFFTKYPAITDEIHRAFEFESSEMKTMYDNDVIICSKKHANIWTPLTFPFPYNDNCDSAWQEILIYRDGHEVFPLSHKYNYQILLGHDKVTESLSPDDIKIIKYNKSSDDNNTWLFDNNLIGYQAKSPVNMDEFKILCLGHNEEQFSTIKNRDYLDKINLNKLNTKLGNEYAEARIYDIDFTELFPEEKKYIGLVTASWNKKYIGINPIDKLHEWPAIRKLDENVILCANTEPSMKFIDGFFPVMKDVLLMNVKQCEEFLEYVGLKVIAKNSPLSNQIIAKRSIVKQLFDFYKKNDILKKIRSFIIKNNIKANKAIFESRKEAYLSEFTTVFWIANQDFIILPQEIRKTDWYWNNEKI